jgi:hypothetical protein
MKFIDFFNLDIINNAIDKIQYEKFNNLYFIYIVLFVILLVVAVTFFHAFLYDKKKDELSKLLFKKIEAWVFSDNMDCLFCHGLFWMQSVDDVYSDLCRRIFPKFNEVLYKNNKRLISIFFLIILEKKKTMITV